jgi:hypothetical protein
MNGLTPLAGMAGCTVAANPVPGGRFIYREVVGIAQKPTKDRPS